LRLFPTPGRSFKRIPGFAAWTDFPKPLFIVLLRMRDKSLRLCSSIANLIIGKSGLNESVKKMKTKTRELKWARWSALLCSFALTAVCAIEQQTTSSAFGSVLPLHKIHVSVAQLEFNQTSQSVECVIRVYADDLENALSLHSKRQIKIDPAVANKDKRLSETVLAYLQEKFEMKNSAGRPVKLNWVGMEWQVDMFWLRVEGKMPNGLDGSQLRNRIFFDLYDDQVNIVNSKIQDKQIGLIFESKDDFKTITNRVVSKSK